MEGSVIERLDFGKMGYGCKHYRRRCRIRAPCCNEVYSCRHCHNEATSMLKNPFDRHELVRQDVEQVVCAVCDTEQPVAQVCTNCGVRMGEYFCEICKFFDDDTGKQQFHCDDCGICRVGGSENYFHCQKCEYYSMGKNWWCLILVSWLCLFSFLDARELKARHTSHLAQYNHTLATILVEYASAVYLSDSTQLITWTCSRCGDLTKGFEIIELVVDVEHCLQAFVGVADDPHAIIIAFRGTNEHSLQNWIEDLYWKQHEINYPDMDDAMVHRGFYIAYHNTTIRPAVLGAVERAKKFYGDIPIIVTGHSMGGAMAAFCALDLTVNKQENKVQVMTFGQPRIGNGVFASLYSKLVPNTIRVTHDHDIVPHLPPYYYHLPQKTYQHFPREVWLYNIGLGSLVYRVEKICDGSGEDPSCSRSVSGNSITDHLEYYGVDMGSDDPEACRIVMNSFVQNTGIRDSKGNLVLARDPATPLLKLSREFDSQEKPISVH